MSQKTIFLPWRMSVNLLPTRLSVNPIQETGLGPRFLAAPLAFLISGRKSR